MEDSNLDCQNFDYSPEYVEAEGEVEKSSSSGFCWVLSKGLCLGKKLALTGVVVTSAPIVIPPLLVVSALGVASSVPFGFIFASYACTEKILSKLLPLPEVIEYEEETEENMIGYKEQLGDDALFDKKYYQDNAEFVVAAEDHREDLGKGGEMNMIREEDEYGVAVGDGIIVPGGEVSMPYHEEDRVQFDDDDAAGSNEKLINDNDEVMQLTDGYGKELRDVEELREDGEDMWKEYIVSGDSVGITEGDDASVVTHIGSAARDMGKKEDVISDGNDSIDMLQEEGSIIAAGIEATSAGTPEAIGVEGSTTPVEIVEEFVVVEGLVATAGTPEAVGVEGQITPVEIVELVVEGLVTTVETPETVGLEDQIAPVEIVEELVVEGLVTTAETPGVEGQITPVEIVEELVGEGPINTAGAVEEIMAEGLISPDGTPEVVGVEISITSVVAEEEVGVEGPITTAEALEVESPVTPVEIEEKLIVESPITTGRVVEETMVEGPDRTLEAVGVGISITPVANVEEVGVEGRITTAGTPEILEVEGPITGVEIGEKFVVEGPITTGGVLEETMVEGLISPVGKPEAIGVEISIMPIASMAEVGVEGSVTTTETPEALKVEGPITSVEIAEQFVVEGSMTRNEVVEESMIEGPISPVETPEAILVEISSTLVGTMEGVGVESPTTPAGTPEAPGVESPITPIKKIVEEFAVKGPINTAGVAEETMVQGPTSLDGAPEAIGAETSITPVGTVEEVGAEGPITTAGTPEALGVAGSISTAGTREAVIVEGPINLAGTAEEHLVKGPTVPSRTVGELEGQALSDEKVLGSELHGGVKGRKVETAETGLEDKTGLKLERGSELQSEVTDTSSQKEMDLSNLKGKPDVNFGGTHEKNVHGLKGAGKGKKGKNKATGKKKTPKPPEGPITPSGTPEVLGGEGQITPTRTSEAQGFKGPVTSAGTRESIRVEGQTVPTRTAREEGPTVPVGTVLGPELHGGINDIRSKIGTAQTGLEDEIGIKLEGGSELQGKVTDTSSSQKEIVQSDLKDKLDTNFGGDDEKFAHGSKGAAKSKKGRTNAKGKKITPKTPEGPITPSGKLEALGAKGQSTPAGTPVALGLEGPVTSAETPEATWVEGPIPPVGTTEAISIVLPITPVGIVEECVVEGPITLAGTPEALVLEGPITAVGKPEALGVRHPISTNGIAEELPVEGPTVPTRTAGEGGPTIPVGTVLSPDLHGGMNDDSRSKNRTAQTSLEDNAGMKLGRESELQGEVTATTSSQKDMVQSDLKDKLDSNFGGGDEQNVHGLKAADKSNKRHTNGKGKKTRKTQKRVQGDISEAQVKDKDQMKHEGASGKVNSRSPGSAARESKLICDADVVVDGAGLSPQVVGELKITEVMPVDKNKSGPSIKDGSKSCSEGSIINNPEVGSILREESKEKKKNVDQVARETANNESQAQMLEVSPPVHMPKQDDEASELKGNSSAHKADNSHQNDKDVPLDDEIWKQIDSIRLIVGFKLPRHASYFEELKALYLFTGIEPPSLFRDPIDMPEFCHKLRFLMSVIGVK